MIPTIVKVAFVRTYLGKLKQVDHGSTVAGTIATILLSQIVDLGKLLGGTQLEQTIEIAKIALILTLWFVFFMMGKPQKIQEILDEMSDATPAIAAGVKDLAEKSNTNPNVQVPQKESSTGTSSGHVHRD